MTWPASSSSINDHSDFHWFLTRCAVTTYAGLLDSLLLFLHIISCGLNIVSISDFLQKTVPIKVVPSTNVDVPAKEILKRRRVLEVERLLLHRETKGRFLRNAKFRGGIFDACKDRIFRGFDGLAIKHTSDKN